MHAEPVRKRARPICPTSRIGAIRLLSLPRRPQIGGENACAERRILIMLSKRLALSSPIGKNNLLSLYQKL
jgi:hypothetical protein